MSRAETARASGDMLARETALDTTRSFVVKAPAGSGKTELLTSRFLKLLGEVESPEQILAITFTRAATAEMRNRILGELEKARDLPPAFTDDDKLKLARRALHHAKQHNWHLLEQPNRLRIETIDSFCASLAQQTPILSRLGGALKPTEDAAPIYRLAARRTLQQIGGSRQELSDAIRKLLLLRDNNFNGCESLLARMLEQRDQWSHAFVLSSEAVWDADYDDAVRRRLEAPLQRAIEKALRRAHSLLNRCIGAADELLAIGHFACRNLRDPEYERYHSHLQNTCALESLVALPGTTVDQLDAWKAITSLMLVLEDKWRTALNVSIGFPPGSTEMKNRFETLRDRLDHTPGMLDALCEVRGLPPPHYNAEQWRLLRAFFTALRHATAELRVAFAERNEIDFVELGIAAEQVLQASDTDSGTAPSDLALTRSDRLKHLLVDEFQDISRRQHRLVAQMVRGWDEADGRGCFVVGDPMQSIYLFRHAEVELFERTYADGLRTSEGAYQLTDLELTKNFRSDRELVEPLNAAFSAIFASGPDPAIQVPFTPAEATRRGGKARVFTLHADFVVSGPECNKATEEAHEREAQEMLRIIRKHMPAIETARANGGEYRVAVLARAKKHLLHLTQHLRESGIPFRAVELEPLGERQEVLDLLSLVRALLHPMDRLAWLSILRAPWCGLRLADLHMLCGADDAGYRDVPVPELLRQRGSLLSPGGRMRAQRLQAILQGAAQLRSEQLSMKSFASIVERAWYSLGGPACVDATGRENVELFLQMLAELPGGEIDCLGEELTRRLNRLCARPDPETNERCGVVLMTIHKAKGLGFEVVLVPALERQTGSNESQLLSWLERTVPAGEPDHGEDEILVAPIGSKGEGSDTLKKWVEGQRRLREAEERKRLLYVACTRARKELHLFGVATIKESANQAISLSPGHTSSLLKTGWAAFEKDFVAALPQWQERQRAQEAEAERASELLPFPGPLIMDDGGDDDATHGGTVIDMAASAYEPQRGKLLRLKAAALNLHPERNVTATVTLIPHPEQAVLDRPEGSLLARAFGVVVHAMLERLTQLLMRTPVEEARKQVSGWKQQITTMLVQQGVDPVPARSQTERAIRALEATLDDPPGRWVVTPHAQAETEAQWTAVLKGTLRRLRADRVFRSGKVPGMAGDECFWIIDYKTSEYSAAAVDDFLARQRVEYEPQLAAYANILRLQYGSHIDVSVGLYYPLLKRLTWWQI